MYRHEHTHAGSLHAENKTKGRDKDHRLIGDEKEIHRDY